MKFYFLIGTLLCLLFTGHAQKLDIGDHVPDLALNNLINAPKENGHLSDFKGKYIILDFWHTRCSGCIEEFPKMQALQTQFKNKLKIILITYETKKMVLPFLVRYQRVVGVALKLPVVCDKKLVDTYFDPQSFPHCVWIDTTGVIRFITNGAEVNEGDVAAFTEGKNLEMARKEDDNSFSTMDIFHPLYYNGNGGNGKDMIYYSMISKSTQSTPTIGIYSNPQQRSSSIVALDMSIKTLFRSAFNDYLNGYILPSNRIESRVKDTPRYEALVNEVMQWQDMYNYQLFAPFRSIDSLRKMMQQDLQRYFGFEAHMERRTMPCWVMTASDTTLLMNKTGGDVLNGFDMENLELTIQNLPDSVLLRTFAYIMFEKSPYPFINRIHMQSHIDIFLKDLDYLNTDAVISRLKEKYKIDIHLENCPVDILVVTEPGYRASIASGS